MDAEVVATSGKEDHLIAESGSQIELDILVLPRIHDANGYNVCMQGQYGISEEVIGPLRNLAL